MPSICRRLRLIRLIRRLEASADLLPRPALFAPFARSPLSTTACSLTLPARGRGPLEALAEVLEGHPQRRLIERAVLSLLEVARSEKEDEEVWRLISGCLADISEALQVFRPSRAEIGRAHV